MEGSAATKLGQRFLFALIVSAIATAAAGREWGEDVAVRLLDTPTTTTGWQVIGWLVGGPPLFLAFQNWVERRRLTEGQLSARATMLGLWLGLGGFLVPAFVDGRFEHFGTGIDVGAPLTFGWACAGVANLAALLFAGGLQMLAPSTERIEVRHRASAERAHRLRLKFLEVAWLLLLLGSAMFAANGKALGFVY